MNFIVFDLEWNSAQPGKAGIKENRPELPFEIIEIGAVKLSPELEPLAFFSANVRPVVYKKINKYIARVTQRDQESLMQGDPFSLVASDFADFCGADAILASWGQSDPEVLKQNLEFHHLESTFFTKALDLQVLFSHLAESGVKSQQRSIEYALEFLRIDADLSFHNALNDARYAGRILNALLLDVKTEAERRDALRPFLYNPFLEREKRWQETVAAGSGPEAIIRGQEYKCPACGRVLNSTEPLVTTKKKKRWTWLLYCEQHGQLRCQINRRRHEGKDVYHFRLTLPYPPL